MLMGMMISRKHLRSLKQTNSIAALQQNVRWLHRAGLLESNPKALRSQTDMKRCYLHHFKIWNLHCHCWTLCIRTRLVWRGAWAQLHLKGVNNIFSNQFGISGLLEIWITPWSQFVSTRFFPNISISIMVSRRWLNFYLWVSCSFKKWEHFSTNKGTHPALVYNYTYLNNWTTGPSACPGL